MQIAQLIGGAGTGKTRELIACMDRAVERLHDPHLVGFVSFTRAACDEAADRAADRFNMRRAELRERGWFKTIHGVAYRCLGVGAELLTDDREADRQWTREALGEADEKGREDAETLDCFAQTRTPGEKALRLWDAARSRLEGLERLWALADQCDDRTPSYADCAALVERYEQAKRLDGRLDFTDMLGRFAGYRFTIDGPYQVTPDGEPPELSCWIHDEMQDSSRLLDACFRRLIGVDTVQWVYISGDPYQSIFGWSGADHRCFLDYPTAKRRIMPKSWRCPATILALGEKQLHVCSDYWDRGIEPNGPGGDVEEATLHNGWAEAITPEASWLVLARTNFLCVRLAKKFDDMGIPYIPTKKESGSRWKAPRRNLAIKGFMALEAGAGIDGREWQAMLGYVPAQPYTIRGTKSLWAQLTDDQALARGGSHWLTLADLTGLGATDILVEAVRSRTWREVVEGAADYTRAVEQWGQDAVDNPLIRLGTIHSAKGLEADNVAILTSSSLPCIRQTDTQEGADEEARLRYVAVTRARKRLVLVRDLHAPYTLDIEA